MVRLFVMKEWAPVVPPAVAQQLDWTGLRFASCRCAADRRGVTTAQAVARLKQLQLCTRRREVSSR